MIFTNNRLSVWLFKGDLFPNQKVIMFHHFKKRFQLIGTVAKSVSVQVCKVTGSADLVKHQQTQTKTNHQQNCTKKEALQFSLYFILLLGAVLLVLRLSVCRSS